MSNIKKATITAYGGGMITIIAPEGKEMVYDQNALQHGILSLGEYGPSGVKIAVFKDWTEALLVEDGGSEGYSITRS